MSKEAMKLALGKIKSAKDCHFAAIDTLLFEAEEILEKALAEQPAQLPFGVGGGLVAIKTLLSRDPCVHANTAIQMIDAILAEQPAPPPECQTEAEKTAFAFGWWKALEAQPAQQEPVYFCDYGYEGWGKVDADMAAENRACGMTVEAYYTSPSAHRKPLTDEQITAIYNKTCEDWTNRYERPVVFARAIEAAHHIKGDA